MIDVCIRKHLVNYVLLRRYDFASDHNIAEASIEMNIFIPALVFAWHILFFLFLSYLRLWIVVRFNIDLAFCEITAVTVFITCHHSSILSFLNLLLALLTITK